MEKIYNSFIFTHIPKCGGTSFRKYINDTALNSGVNKKKIYIPGHNKLANNKNIPQLSQKELKNIRKQEIKVLANHAKFDVERTYDLNIQDPFMYTIFREPVARFISHYNFFYYKNGYEECGGLTLDDLPLEKLEYLIQMLSNIQVRYLSNIKHVKVVGFENMTKLAKYNLMYIYGSFGVLEQMDLSVKVLQNDSPSWLKFENDFPIKNKNIESSSYQASERVIELIKKHNEFDIELYEFSNDLLKKKAEELPADKEINITGELALEEN